MAAKKRAVKKRTAKKTVNRAVKKAAKKKTVSKKVSAVKKTARKTTKRKRPKKSFSFSELKEKINSKVGKTIIALSFISVTFPSLYQWGQDHISDVVDTYSPQVISAAHGAVDSAVNASPLAKTAAGYWIVSKMAALSSGGGVSAGSPVSASGKVDLVVNPFY